MSDRVFLANVTRWTVALAFAGFAFFQAGRVVALQASPPKPASNATAPAKTSPTVLEGVVKDPAQKLVAGARVLVWRLSRLHDPPVSTRTDAAGRFHLSLTGPGGCRLRVSAPGMAPLVLEKVEPGRSLSLVLAKGGVIEGVVRDAVGGGPLAKAQVRAQLEAFGGHSVWWEDDAPTAATDARGNYRIEGLAPGLYSVTATARGFGSATRPNLRLGARVDLALRPGAFVFGTVRGPNGRPLEGALARAEGPPGLGGPVTAPRPTDALGRFEVSGLAAGTYSLVVRHPDLAPALVTSVHVESEGGLEVAVAMSAGATVTGRLVGPGERPVAGRVGLEDSQGAAVPGALSEIVRGEAGTDGRFRLPGVPPGDLVFGVQAPGFAGKRVEAAVGDGQAEVDLGDVELTSGLTIRGRVRDRAGTGIPDASIWAGQPRETGDATDTRAGADGGFVLAGLHPGLYNLTVSSPGYARLEERPVEAGAEGIDIVLAPGGAISGSVVDESQRPVEAFRVATEAPRGEGWRSSGPGEAKSSPDGRFTIEELPEGTRVVKVEAPGFQAAVVSDVKVVAGRTADLGVIRLARGGVVRGVVVDRAGQAVPFATIQSRAAGNENVWYGDLPQATSDLAGAFEITGLRPGRLALLAHHPDYAAGSVSDVDVEPGKGATEVRVVLSRGGRVDGSVKKRDGSPVAGMRVNLQRSGPLFGMEPAVEPGPDGSFALNHVPEGSLAMALLAGDSTGARFVSIQTRTVEVREGETSEVSFVVRETLVSGRVTRSAAPVVGARVRLRGLTSMVMMFSGPARTTVQPSGPQRMEAVAREDGAYELLVDDPGRYFVEVSDGEGKRSFPTRTVTVPDVDAYALDLDFGGLSVSGVVVNKETGQGVARAQVRLDGKRPGGGGGGAGSTEPDGSFALEAEEGEYDLSVRGEGFASTRSPLRLSGGGASGLRLELARGLVLEGRVLDVGGRPLAGAMVSAFQEGEKTLEVVGTLPDGAFRFSTLDARPYNLFVGSELAGFATRAGVTPSGEPVVLPLRPAGRLRVTLRDAAGQPVQGAHVNAWRVDGAAFMMIGVASPQSDPRGVAELVAPAGQLALAASKGALSGKAEVTVREGETVAVEMKMTDSGAAPH